jgi:hypothetical protein
MISFRWHATCTHCAPIFCSFIRPVLEYACPVWHSSLPNSFSDQIEHIQKRALKIILPDRSYHESLKTLKLLSPPQSLLKYLQITYMKFLNKSGRARCDGKIEMKLGRLCQIMRRSMVFEPI